MVDSKEHSETEIEQISIRCRQEFWIALGLPHFALWLAQKTRATLYTNQIPRITNRDLITRVFPRSSQFARFYLRSHCDISIVLIGCLFFFVVWFVDTQP